MRFSIVTCMRLEPKPLVPTCSASTSPSSSPHLRLPRNGPSLVGRGTMVSQGARQRPRRRAHGDCIAVKAFVDFDNKLSGSMTSTPVAVWISTNPSPPGEIPYPTDLSVQHFSEDLGVR